MSTDPNDEATVSLIAPMTENTFVAEGAGTDDPPPLVRGSVGRLTAWVFPAGLTIAMVSAIPGVLIPIQLALIDSAAKEANLAVVLSVAGFGSLVAGPIAGQISDRTRSRLGRRAPWILIGAFALALALVGMVFADGVLGITIAWLVAQVAINVAQGPFSTILPDRVPLRRRGTFAAVSGVALMSGAVLGAVVAAVFADNYAIGYFVFAALSLVVLVLFVLFNPDHSSRDMVVERFGWMDFLRTFWVNPIAHPDFFWAFTARLLLFVGYYMVIGYQFYLLSDYIGIERPQDYIPLFGVVGLIGIIISNVVSGPLSDRVGRRKPFVFGASAVMAIALAIPWAWPTLTGWGIMFGVLALGFGMYVSVDTALMSEVLPSAKSFGKDLGVINIAAALPQTIGPAIAGVIILNFDYGALFPVGIVLSLLGAFAIWPIKSVR